MEKLRKRIHDNSNGLDYVLVGDYYIPDLKLAEENGIKVMPDIHSAAPLGSGDGCTRHFCKNIAPASTMNCFCRENSGRILPI